MDIDPIHHLPSPVLLPPPSNSPALTQVMPRRARAGQIQLTLGVLETTATVVKRRPWGFP